MSFLMVHSLPDSFLNSAIVSIPNDRNISITCENCIALSSVYLKIVDTISDINTVLHKYSILATLVPVDSSFGIFFNAATLFQCFSFQECADV